MKRNSILLAITFFAASCYYDKADLVYPVASTYDTTAVKYSTAIAPVLTAN
jgi:hypothetical protein